MEKLGKIDFGQKNKTCEHVNEHEIVPHTEAVFSFLTT